MHAFGTSVLGMGLCTNCEPDAYRERAHVLGYSSPGTPKV